MNSHHLTGSFRETPSQEPTLQLTQDAPRPFQRGREEGRRKTEAGWRNGRPPSKAGVLIRGFTPLWRRTAPVARGPGAHVRPETNRRIDGILRWSFWWFLPRFVNWHPRQHRINLASERAAREFGASEAPACSERTERVWPNIPVVLERVHWINVWMCFRFYTAVLRLGFSVETLVIPAVWTWRRRSGATRDARVEFFCPGLFFGFFNGEGGGVIIFPIFDERRRRCCWQRRDALSYSPSPISVSPNSSSVFLAYREIRGPLQFSMVLSNAGSGWLGMLWMGLRNLSAAFDMILELGDQKFSRTMGLRHDEHDEAFTLSQNATGHVFQERLHTKCMHDNVHRSIYVDAVCSFSESPRPTVYQCRKCWAELKINYNWRWFWTVEFYFSSFGVKLSLDCFSCFLNASDENSSTNHLLQCTFYSDARPSLILEVLWLAVAVECLKSWEFL